MLAPPDHGVNSRSVRRRPRRLLRAWLPQPGLSSGSFVFGFFGCHNDEASGTPASRVVSSTGGGGGVRVDGSNGRNLLDNDAGRTVTTATGWYGTSAKLGSSPQHAVMAPSVSPSTNVLQQRRLAEFNQVLSDRLSLLQEHILSQFRCH